MNESEIAEGLSPTPGYRYADQVGLQLFVAGQVPLDGDGGLVGESDPATQAGQCLSNLHLLLGVHGFDSSDIRHMTVHVVGHQADLATAWEAVRDHFDGNVPPATLLGATALGFPGQLVEIDAIVVKA